MPMGSCLTIGEKKQQSLRPSLQSLEAQSFRWEHEGVGPFPGCDDEFRRNAFHSSPVTFQMAACRGPAEGITNNIRHLSSIFPGLRLEFESFRRLGIAFWENRRLMALELYRPDEEKMALLRMDNTSTPMTSISATLGGPSSLERRLKTWPVWN